MPWTLPVFGWVCPCSRHFYHLDLETEMMTTRKCEKEVETFVCVYVYVCMCDQDRKHSERTVRTGRQRHRTRERRAERTR